MRVVEDAILVGIVEGGGVLDDELDLPDKVLLALCGAGLLGLGIVVLGGLDG